MNRKAIAIYTVLLGLLADQLVRGPGRPGLNVALWAMAGTALLWLIARTREQPIAKETRWFVTAALGFAFLLVLRDAAALAVFCLLSAIALLGLAAGRGARAWATRAQATDLAVAAVRVGVLVLLGPFGWNLGGAHKPNAAPPVGARRWTRHARMVARGTVMALPALVVLTALLTSADPVFERVLHNALFTDIQPLLGHLAFAAVIAWLTSGYLRAFVFNNDDVVERVRIPRPDVASSEIVVALSLLNLLFAAFMIVQVRYLFGGSALVEVTKGLTYAAYARRGFVELVVATALVVPLLLIADWAASERSLRSRRAFHATSALLVLLLLGVLASAAYRLWLYQDAYGLTEDRLYGSVFMLWLTFLLGWLALTMLRGRRNRFAIGAIVAGFTCIAVLHVVNPHALIARVNISRAASGAEVDAKYLRLLSADAVPTLIARLPELPQAERCNVLTMLRKRWTGERLGGWRTWNLSDARARNLISELPSADCH